MIISYKNFHVLFNFPFKLKQMTWNTPTLINFRQRLILTPSLNTGMHFNFYLLDIHLVSLSINIFFEAAA